MALHTEPPAAVPAPADYHGAVSEFKRRLIETTLQAAHGNRTHAARRLGLQRTYLLRLIRELRVSAPPPPERRRHAEVNALPPRTHGLPADRDVLPHRGAPAGPNADGRGRAAARSARDGLPRRA